MDQEHLKEPTAEADDERDPLELLVDEFVARLRRAEYPSVSEYVAGHPELADDIRELFPTIAAMEQVKVPRHSAGSGRAVLGADRPERLGDFRLLREIGRGGMGIVYEAEQQSLGRHVAVKVLPKLSLLDSKHLRRFQREAQTAARLHHTNIVPVFGVGEHDGFHYIVMQRIRGVGLDELLQRFRSRSRGKTGDAQPTAAGVPLANEVVTLVHALLEEKSRDAPSADSRACSSPSDDTRPLETGAAAASPTPSAPLSRAASAPGAGDASWNDIEASPTPAAETKRETAPGAAAGAPVAIPSARPGRSYWQTVAELGVQAADALHYAHSHGVLHRDVKPANLLLDDQGVVWISDFGLAKAREDDQVSRTGDVVGTLRYMAPEQFRGEYDARSDVYSLGLTLYELAVLEPAFGDSDRSGLMQHIAEGEPTRPRKLQPGLPHDLETIVLRAIARQPSDRYASAAELADDLRRFLEDRSILARRATPPERAVRWARRNPAIAGLTSAVLVLLLAVAVVASVAYFQAQRANVLVRQALSGETKQREKAETTSELALNVLDRIYAQLAPGTLTGTSSLTVEDSDGEAIEVPLQPVISTETAALLESLLGFYDQLAEQGGDLLHVRQQTAKANVRVAAIRRHLGQFDEAAAAYERALAVYRQLAAESGSEQSYRVEMAQVHNELGNLYRANEEPQHALAAHQAALELLTSNEYESDSKDASDGSAPAAVRFELAHTYYCLGTFRRAGQGSMAGGPEPGPPDAGRGPRGLGPPEVRPDFHPPGAQHFPPGDGPPAHPPGPERFRPGEGPRFRPPGRGPRPFGQADMQRPHSPPGRTLPPGQHPGDAGGALGHETYLQQAIALLEDLCREHPSTAAYRHLLARCYRDATPWHASHDETLERMDKATKILGQLVDEFPGVPDYRHDLIEAYAAVDVRGPMLTPETMPLVEQLLQTALELSERLVAEHPNVPVYATSQVHIHHKLAEIYRRFDRGEDAETSLRKAVDLQASLVEQFPDAVSYRLWLATIQHSLARLLVSRDELEQARPLWEQSVAVLEPLLDRESRLPHVRGLLAESYRNLADVLQRLGQREEAQENRRRARQLRPGFHAPESTLP